MIPTTQQEINLIMEDLNDTRNQVRQQEGFSAFLKIATKSPNFMAMLHDIRRGINSTDPKATVTTIATWFYIGLLCGERIAMPELVPSYRLTQELK